MKQARESGLAVGFVSVTERKSVVDWLEGKIPEHEKIVPLVGESLSGCSCCLENKRALQWNLPHLQARRNAVVQHRRYLLLQEQVMQT